MSIAILGSKFNNDEEQIVTLDSGMLYYIDNITRTFENEDELKNSEYYHEKITQYSLGHDNADGKIVLSYIKNNTEKVQLDLLLNEDTPIRTRTSSLDEFKSETERARKLLLNSKNQMFLTMFLLNDNLLHTTDSTVKMTIEEYKNAKKEGYKVTVQDGEYRISIREVLKYRLNHKKLGSMRLLVEDTLEVWKKNMLGLKDDELYFYSRELRLMINEYNYRKIPRKAVYNLSINRDNLIETLVIERHNNFSFVNTLGLPKRKVLDERKAS